MTRDLERLLEWRRREVELAFAAFRPVFVVVDRLDAGDALVTCLRSAAGSEVRRDHVGGADVRARVRQLPARRREEALATRHRRPTLGRAPFLGMGREVMDRILVAQAGLAIAEMLIEEAQYLAQHGELGFRP